MSLVTAAGSGIDERGANLVLRASGLLGAFNRAGVLAAADVHVAMRLTRLGGEDDERVALAAALAVRGPRFGHVFVDLAAVRDAAADLEEEIDLDVLPWPEPDDWVRVLAGSQLVARGDDDPAARPLRLVGTALYLDRYWRDEQAVATDLLGRAQARQLAPDLPVLADGLARLFTDDDSGEQRWAAATALLRHVSVIAGGPGTGKTTTVGRVLALLEEQARAMDVRPPLVGLAAPTGKAAARLEEAVHAEARRMMIDPATRARILSVGASTLHRLLGRRPDSSSRFRHDRHNRLPHDVLIVDETSMVPLSLMARLTEAVRKDARLILVGDPEQLASVEAGAVLGDIVGPAQQGMRMTQGARARLARVTGRTLNEITPAVADSFGDGIVLLRSNHRFGGVLAELAASVRSGNEDHVIALLSRGDPACQWLPTEPAIGAAVADSSGLQPVRAALTATGTELREAAKVGDGDAALSALSRFRVLCAHRRGPAGVDAWTTRIEEWLSVSVTGFADGGTWYVGRPVVVTANDYGLQLFNGDTGVVVARPGGGMSVVFRRGGSLVSISPSRLSSADTVFAMTVHKAQGSEFRDVAVLLPPSTSPILTRELLYTAVTRARISLILAGSEESIRAAIARPVARASGLTRRLWGLNWVA
jgi:exodeoxyribonuclease V alpha subunit